MLLCGLVSVLYYNCKRSSFMRVIKFANQKTPGEPCRKKKKKERKKEKKRTVFLRLSIEQLIRKGIVGGANQWRI